MTNDDYLPLRMVNQMRYCERRFWYMHVLGEMDENAPVLEGIAQHERAHTAGQTQQGDLLVHRRAWLWNDRLRIAGLGDVVEERAGSYYPIEYKRGRLGKAGYRWDNDQVQLCAQALCIEERYGVAVPEGAIFYNASRHRMAVRFDEALRTLTEATIARALALLSAGRVPPPLPNELRPRCRDCSLLSKCMPDEVLKLRVKSDE
jgi:CRISPR-associated exonuclease Cas4